MKEGYAFLDEKRMILAAGMLKRLRLHHEREAHRAEGMAAAAEGIDPSRRTPRRRRRGRRVRFRKRDR